MDGFWEGFLIILEIMLLKSAVGFLDAVVSLLLCFSFGGFLFSEMYVFRCFR